MKLIQIVDLPAKDFHAGAKAPRDVSEIATELGFERFLITRKSSTGRLSGALLRILWVVKSFWYVLSFPKQSTVLIQYPNKWLTGRLGCALVERLRVRCRIRIITLVHDIDALRSSEKMLDNLSRWVFDLSDVLIVHNEAMRKWLISQGFDNKPMVELGVFDYLTDAAVTSSVDRFNKVIIAGNLDAVKTGYLSRLNEIADVDWMLYGVNFDDRKTSGPNIHYQGCYSPEELPGELNGSFGLVWDGISVETCAGPYGDYLRYNNPHKFSLYMAAGIPVIVWSHSAIAELVINEKLGIVIDSLQDIAHELKRIDVENYRLMKKRVEAFSARIRRGEYVASAIKTGLSKIS